MATLGTAFGGAALAMGGSKKEKAKGPPIEAKSSDEEAFIKYVLQFLFRFFGHLLDWAQKSRGVRQLLTEFVHATGSSSRTRRRS